MMARPQRLRGDVRSTGSLGTVSPGQWIVVPVSGNPFPATIEIGRLVKPAFVDFEKRNGTRTTVVKIRCPDLPPGDYDVTAVHAAGVERVSVTIV